MRKWKTVRGALEFLAVVVVALVLIGAGEEPEAPGERERMAQFFAQEEYYSTLGEYGDIQGAVEAAQVVYEGLVEP